MLKVSVLDKGGEEWWKRKIAFSVLIIISLDSLEKDDILSSAIYLNRHSL